MSRDIEFRFYEDGQYYYFSVPYMTCQMFNKLQEPASDNRTFEQYIGLKDKNGKKIYEGNLCYLAGIGTACVQWSEYTLGFVFVTDQNEYEYQDIIEDLASLEIIGNINEEPTC